MRKFGHGRATGDLPLCTARRVHNIPHLSFPALSALVSLVHAIERCDSVLPFSHDALSPSSNALSELFVDGFPEPDFRTGGHHDAYAVTRTFKPPES